MKRPPYVGKAPPSRMALLTRVQAAKMFGVSVSLLEKIASRGEGLPHYSTYSRAARTVYRVEDLEVFFRDRFGDEYVQSMQAINCNDQTTP